MARPDLITLAVLHYKGIIDHGEVAALEALCARKAEYDLPAVIDFDSAMGRVVDVLETCGDDRMIAERIDGCPTEDDDDGDPYDDGQAFADHVIALHEALCPVCH
jgi:hypothetical protein